MCSSDLHRRCLADSRRRIQVHSAWMRYTTVWRMFISRIAGPPMSEPPPTRPSSGNFKSTLFGMAISVGCIWVLTRMVDVDQTVHALRGVDPYPLALSVVLTAITVACRALRWQALLRPESRSGFWSAVEATLIGYLFIAVLPGKIGRAHV